MIDLIKKILDAVKIYGMVIMIVLAVIVVFIHFINQDKPKTTADPITENRKIIYQTINDSQYTQTKEGKLYVMLYRGLTCGLIGEACTNNPADGDKNYSHSLLGGVANLITLPYRNPPASGVYWAMSSLENAGFIPKTYAAEGIGFAAISPLMNLWKVFRDLAYMLFVLVFIVIGFMIMFRAKLNPQTVIGVESALPRIVISLILITFSFALAGFLIDLMYVIITLAISIMSDRSNFYNITQMQNRYLNPDFLQIAGGMFPSKPNPSGYPILDGWGALNSVSQAFINLMPDFLNQILRTILGTAFTVVVGYKFLSGFSSAIGDLRTLGAGTGSLITAPIRVILYPLLLFISFVIGYNALPLFFMLLIGLTVLALFFRIFFLLLTTYLKILLMIVFSPIFMMFEAIPGKNAFGYWFKNFIAELLVFPTIIVLMLVGYIIVNTPAITGELWQPPFLVNINPNAFTVLLGFGLIFQIPDFVKLVKEMVGAKDMPIGLNLGTFFGGAAGVGGGAMGTISSIGTLRLGLQGFGEAMGAEGGPLSKFLTGMGLKRGKS